MTAGGRLAAISCLLGLALSGCTAPQTRVLLERPPGDLQTRTGIAGVPFVSGTDTLCGPSSLAMILAHRGYHESVAELRAEVYLPARAGAVQAEMLAALRARDLLAYPVQPSIEGLLRELQAGNPVLVLQNLGLSWLPRWHYAVAVGYDLQQGVVILRSGRMPRRLTGLSVFENTWARSGHWAVVAAPPTTPPATADALGWIRAASDLAQVGRRPAADTAMTTATRHWPRQALVWLSAANTALDAGDAARAADLARTATRLAPGNADAWNNLAHLLLMQDCRAAARSAIGCALAIDADAALYRQTLDEINAWVGPVPAAVCATPACPQP